MAQAMVAVPAWGLIVMTGVGRVSVTTCVVTSEISPLRTLTALIVTGEVALLARSSGVPSYTVPMVAVGSLPSRV